MRGSLFFNIVSGTFRKSPYLSEFVPSFLNFDILCGRQLAQLLGDLPLVNAHHLLKQHIVLQYYVELLIFGHASQLISFHGSGGLLRLPLPDLRHLRHEGKVGTRLVGWWERQSELGRMGLVVTGGGFLSREGEAGTTAEGPKEMKGVGVQWGTRKLLLKGELPRSYYDIVHLSYLLLPFHLLPRLFSPSMTTRHLLIFLLLRVPPLSPDL